MDKYAHLAPGAGDRSCRRADGGPKRRLSEGAALVQVDRLVEAGEAVHAYACDGCGSWHVGHDRRDEVA